VDPSSELQKSGAVKRELNELRGRPSGLPVLAPAPEIRGTQRWFNTPGGRGLKLAQLRDQRRVVLIDFWTYTCINCIRTLPEVTAWDRRYRDAGLTVIGVHTPEFPFEKDAGNVAGAIDRHDIRYPVAQDNDFATWNAFSNQYWPAKYLIDARGKVRYVHFGEGGYDETERAIRSLLAERDDAPLGPMSHAKAEEADPHLATPETYLGAERAEGFVDGPLVPGSHDFGRSRPDLPPNGFALRGRWTVAPESARAGDGARLHARFQARRVFLVLGSPDRPRRMRVLLDGKPIPERLAGSDVRDGTVRIDRQRLYRLVDVRRAGEHELTLIPEDGIEGYAFTFG
jgi:thiol-disulfide isomerase/thioredoxin